MSGNLPRVNGSSIKPYLIPLVTLVLAVGGGYVGRATREGETQTRIATLEAAVKRNTDRLDQFGDRYVTLGEFTRRMNDLQGEQREANHNVLERLKSINDDLNRRYGK